MGKNQPSRQGAYGTNAKFTTFCSISGSSLFGCHPNDYTTRGLTVSLYENIFLAKNVVTIRDRLMR